MNKLKTLAATLCAITLYAPAAGATDIYSGMPAIGWTGFYIGGHIGDAVNDESGDSFFAGGVHAGYNWQTQGNVVVGVEGSFSGTAAEDVDSIASLRARLGYAMGNSLIYATGGFTHFSLNDDYFYDDSASGWTAGAGWEYKWGPSWSVGFEANYYDFEVDDMDEDAWTVFGRISYHFGYGSPSYK